MRYAPPPAELASLVAAIRESPDDDDLRLVCADWYEENGDADRAEFIRVQIERSRLPSADERHALLTARELRLLRLHARRWTTDVHPCLRKVRFRRGFTEHAHLRLTHILHHRRQLLAWEPIRALCLTGRYTADDDLFRRAAGCEELRHVERLRWSAPRRGLAPFLESPHLTRLRSLDARGVGIIPEDERRRILQTGIPARLTSVNMPPITNIVSVSFDRNDPPAAWARLRAVSFTDTAPSRQLSFLFRGRTQAALESLSIDLGDDVSAMTVLAERMPPHLRDIRIHARTRALPSLIDALRAVPLEALHTRADVFSADDLARLLSDGSRVRLRRLTLEGDYTPNHVAAIASGPAAAGVESLRLFGTTRGPITLPDNLLRPTLHRLHLRDPECFDRLADLPGTESLRELVFTDGLPSPDAFERLFRPERLPNLVKLTLASDGYLTDAQAAALRRLPLLSWLRLPPWNVVDRFPRPLADAEMPLWVSPSEVLSGIDFATFPPLDDAFEDDA